MASVCVCADAMSNLGLNVFVCFVTRTHASTHSERERDRESETQRELQRFGQNKYFQLLRVDVEMNEQLPVHLPFYSQIRTVLRNEWL